MILALDTNAYVAFCKANPDAIEAIQRAERILAPLVVIAELRAGFAVGRKGDQNEAVLQRFLSSKRVAIACPDEATTFAYARLFAYLRKKGSPIPINDLWIAALALQRDAILLTFDAHFDLLPQVPKFVAS